MYRYGNPFVGRWLNKSEADNPGVERETATYRGVVGKTVLLLGITIVSAVITLLATWYGIFQFAASETDEISESTITGFTVGAIVAIVLMIVCSVCINASPKTAKIFAPIYSLIQGAFLGFVAAFLELLLPFVALAAVLGTVIVFVVCMLMHKFIGVRVKNNTARVLTISIVCFALAELIIVPIMIFGQVELAYTALIWIQAITTFLCVIFASMTIIYDLQSVDSMVQSGADRKYEWPVAFSLVTSLVYLYLQILRLLLRFFALFSNKRK